MIAVVTGGSGFIGRNLVRRLLHDGHEVRCLVRPGGGSAPQGARQFRVRYDDPRSLLECPALDEAHVVFHLAGATRALDREQFDAANVVPSRNLLGAIVARHLYPKFVYVSSQAAAGPALSLDRAVREEDDPRPVEPYGTSKLQAERLVREYSDRVAATIVRPCAVFGPGDRDLFKLFRMANRGLVLYPGIARHWVSLLHVDDVVAGLLECVRRDTSVCRTYFLSSSEPVQWSTLGGIMAHAAGRSARHLDVPTPVVGSVSLAGHWISRLTGRATIVNRHKAEFSRHRYWVCSAERARAELGFSESRSLPEAVRSTYYWYCQNGWLRGSRGAGDAAA
jgi:nucleoside-diphosphate-sugar epimerase